MRALALMAGWLLVGCAGTRPASPHDGGPVQAERGLSFGDGGAWIADWRTESGLPPPGPDGPRDGTPPADKPWPKPDQPRPDQPQPPDAPPPCPGGCDDGNPCTADACLGNACVHDPAGQVVTRYYNSATGAHAYSPVGAPGAGFVAEGPVFRTLPAPTAGSAPIFQQTNGTDYMLSLSATEGAACCGYWNAGQIGHGFSAATSGTIPLYRLYHGSGLHLSSTSSSEGTQVGYALEGVTVHVCP